jgi:hypothetical protein
VPPGSRRSRRRRRSRPGQRQRQRRRSRAVLVDVILIGVVNVVGDGDELDDAWSGRADDMSRSAPDRERIGARVGTGDRGLDLQPKQSTLVWLGAS